MLCRDAICTVLNFKKALMTVVSNVAHLNTEPGSGLGTAPRVFVLRRIVPVVRPRKARKPHLRYQKRREAYRDCQHHHH